MLLALGVGALGLETGRARVARLLAAVGPVRLIEVRLIDSNGEALVGINKWRPKQDEDLGIIIEEIAGCIAKHKGAGATIRVRRDG
jgi:hypothetical protein